MARYKVELVPNVVNVQECKDCIECNYFHQKYLYYHTCCLQNVADVENLLNVANIHEFKDCIECQSNICRSSYMLSTKHSECRVCIELSHLFLIHILNVEF